MTELRPSTRLLVTAARGDHPSPADRARIRASLALALQAGPPAPHASPGHTGPALPTGATIGAGKAIAGAALIGVLAFAGGFLTGRGSAELPAMQAPAQSSATVAPSPTSAPIPAPPAQPTPSTLPDQPAAIAGNVATKPPRIVTSAAPLSEPALLPTGASTLAEETAALGEAQAALQRGDTKSALDALSELAARHPNGVLREERMAAQVLALCAAGRVEEARAASVRFLTEAPTSLQAERVRHSCAGEGR